MDVAALSHPTHHSWALQVLKKYGLATLLSLVFAWFILSVVHGQLKANVEEAKAVGVKVDAVKDALAQHAADMHVDQTSTRAIQEQQLRALVAICRGQAKTTRERELCGAVK